SRSLRVPPDDKSVYALTETSLYEYQRGSSGVPPSSSPVTFASDLTDANGVMCTVDGLYLYVSHSNGVPRWARDVVTQTPSLIAPSVGTRYKTITVCSSIPEALLGGSILVT